MSSTTLFLHIINLSTNPRLPPPGDDDEITVKMPWTASTTIADVVGKVVAKLNAGPYNAEIDASWVYVHLDPKAAANPHSATISERPAGGDVFVRIKQPKAAPAPAAAAAASADAAPAPSSTVADVATTTPSGAPRKLYVHADDHTVVVPFTPPVPVALLAERIAKVCPAASTYRPFVRNGQDRPLAPSDVITSYPPGGDVSFEPVAGEIEGKIREYFEAAQQMSTRGKFAQAVALYRRLIDSTPGCTVDQRISILHEIGAAHVDARLPAKAIPVYKELIDLTERKKDFTKTATYRGVCGKQQFADGQHLAAAANFLAALQLVQDGKVQADNNYIRDVKV